MSFYCISVLKKVVLRLLWLLVLKWPNYLNCLRSGTKIWKSKSAWVRRRESAFIMLNFWKRTFVCIAANSHLLSSKSKLKEMRVVKLYSMCYPWLSCSKSNCAVQIVAIQNYEPIWFQFSQFEAPSWPICRWRECHNTVYETYSSCWQKVQWTLDAQISVKRCLKCMM